MERSVYSVKEVSRILNIGMNKAYDLIHLNEIPHKKLGRKFVIPKEAFEAWLNKCLAVT